MDVIKKFLALPISLCCLLRPRKLAVWLAEALGESGEVVEGGLLVVVILLLVVMFCFWIVACQLAVSFVFTNLIDCSLNRAKM